MGKITDVTAQKHNPSRVSVYIDGEFACGLEKIAYAHARLAIGDEIDEDRLQKIRIESDTEAAFSRALGYSSYRSRTKKETVRYLIGKGYAPEAVEAAVKKLAEYGYCDDFAFCREYVATYKNRVGVIKIRYDLRRLGAEDEAIESALADLESQGEGALAAARKYLRSREFQPYKLRAHLYNRGFTGEDADYAVSVIAAEESEENADPDDE